MVLRIFRYVDDYIVFVKKGYLTRSVVDVLKVFRECAMGLTFTTELPKQDVLQFLDLRLLLEERHVCWEYFPRSTKSFLNYQSSHTKLVKNGIVFSSLKSAMNKSCLERINESILRQVGRLKSSGYPSHVISRECDKLLRWIKSGDKPKREKKKFVVVPYTHGVGHGLKNVAARYDVDVVFSAPKKLRGVCRQVEEKAKATTAKKKTGGCQTNHKNPFVPCNVGVVYRIPCTCGLSYIGQTGRCINARLSEHHRSRDNGSSCNLARHWREGTCTPLLSNTVILGKHNDSLTREILEAFHIRLEPDSCISDPSVTLTDKEMMFLSGQDV